MRDDAHAALREIAQTLDILDGAEPKPAASGRAEVRILRRPEVERLVGVAKPTLYNWIRKGLFPSSIKLGPQAVGWRSDEVEAWLASRERSAGGGPTVGP